jgi:hypothetical protein
MDFMHTNTAITEERYTEFNQNLWKGSKYAMSLF